MVNMKDKYAPKGSSLLMPKMADTGVSSEPSNSPSVLDFVRQHHDQVEVSDKEVPERFGDLRPIDGQVDPGYFFVPISLSGSRLNSSAINIGNNRVFLKRYKELSGVFPITGDHGAFGVAIRISAITNEMLDDLKGMVEDYPSLDDAEASKAEHELIDEAWNDWAHFDFIRALETHLPEQEEQIDALDDDQARELFDQVRKRIGVEWSPDSTGPFIDVVQIAENVSAGDFTE